MSKMYDPLLFAAKRVQVPHPHSTGLGTIAAAPFVWLWREIQARRDRHLLAALDERSLADVGLSRGSIEYALRNGRRPSDPGPTAVTSPGADPRLPASAWTEWR
jgi:uncharacterized protein YjiS (DUF1127 family)